MLTRTHRARTRKQTPLVTAAKWFATMMDLKSTDTPFNGGASTTLAACYRHARCQAFVAAMRRERRLPRRREQKAAARPQCVRAAPAPDPRERHAGASPGPEPQSADSVSAIGRHAAPARAGRSVVAGGAARRATREYRGGSLDIAGSGHYHLLCKN